MACYRCGARPVDPARGPSDWKRGVRDDAQVLVCPACQQDPAWRTHLASCPHCGSTSLVRALGDVQCRGCGAMAVVAAPPADADHGGRPYDPVLADEVGRAVDRVLRGPVT